MIKIPEIFHFSSFVKTLHCHHASENSEKVLQQVTVIKSLVLSQKDRALIDLAKQFDGADISALGVTKEEIQFAYTQVSDSFIKAVQETIQNVRSYHRKQIPQSWFDELEPGVGYGMQYRPIEKAGLYVPGGKASYPSTVIMNSVPAVLAGVSELVITTPVQSDGRIAPQILVTADLCGVKTIMKSGGAQAIFALAYGTETVPRVDKIVGPGNKYVALAKQLVYGVVDIDKPAGPSEVLVYVDDLDYAGYAAAEFLAQLEHDPDNKGVCLVTDRDILEKVQYEIQLQIPHCLRKDMIEKSLLCSGIYVTNTLEETLLCINQVASEHVMLLTDSYDLLLQGIHHAGAIFCGPYTSVTLGDYFAGPNHVLPTAGAARFASPLSVMDFMKFSSVLTYSKSRLEKSLMPIKILTEMEGLDAHYQAIKKRFEI